MQEKLEKYMDLSNSPEALDAMARLKKGNEIFVKVRGLYLEDESINEPTDEDLAELRDFQKSLRQNMKHMNAHQEPKAAILACADARVTPEIIFSHIAFNALFDTRNAGNVFDEVTLESMNVPASHHTPLLVVLGHTGCGAMNACINQRLSGNINENLSEIINIADETAPQSITNADTLALYNVASSLMKFANTENKGVQDALAAGEFKLAGAIYDLNSGKVNFLDFVLVKKLLEENSRQ